MAIVAKSNGAAKAGGVSAKDMQDVLSLIAQGKMEEAMQLLGEDPNAHKIVTTVEFSDTIKKVIIPKGMSKLQAAQDLKNQYDNEEQKQNFDTTFEGWDWKDSLRAFRNVLEEKFGWIKGVETFWSTPTEIDIVTAIKKGRPVMEKAFYGTVAFPAYEDAKGEVFVNSQGEVILSINAKRKFGEEITMFFKEIHQYLLNNSIYRGKPVVVSEKTVQTRNGAVKVIDLGMHELKVNKNIVLNEDERVTVENFIIDSLSDEGKHTWLFTGSYGNAKTETAIAIGQHAVDRGMAFFYVKKSSMFERVLSFAKNYEPCVIFLEDIDEIASGEDRNEKINEILNTLDGVQTKGRNINVIFTTNHQQRITPALRRPGRIDLIVDFKNPNKDTQKLILLKLLDGVKGVDELDMDKISEKLPDAQGAVIAEIGKRALKLSSRRGEVTTDMVVAAAASMEYQVKFMNEDVEKGHELVEAFNNVRDFLNNDKFFPVIREEEV